MEMLLRNRWWILTWAFASTLFGLSLVRMFPPLYTSYVHFHIQEPDVFPEELQGIHRQGGRQRMNRVYDMARSHAMHDHLIQRFDLGAHYGISPHDPMRFERTMKRLRLRYEVRSEEPGGVVLRVRDHDRERAMLMANEAYSELERRVRLSFKQDLQGAQRMYDQVLKHVQADRDWHERRLNVLVDSAVRLIPADSRPDQSMIQSMERLERFEQELRYARFTRQLIISMNLTDQVPKLVPIRKAMRDSDLDPVVRGFMLVMLTAIVLTVLFIIGLVIWHNQGPELKAAFLSIGRSGADRYEGVNGSPPAHSGTDTMDRERTRRVNEPVRQGDTVEF